MKKIVAILLIAFAIICSGCSNPDIHEEGDRRIVDLPKGTKLISANRYHPGGFSYTFRDRREGEPVEEYTTIDDVNHVYIIREH